MAIQSALHVERKKNHKTTARKIQTVIQIFTYKLILIISL